MTRLTLCCSIDFGVEISLCTYECNNAVVFVFGNFYFYSISGARKKNSFHIFKRLFSYVSPMCCNVASQLPQRERHDVVVFSFGNFYLYAGHPEDIL